MTGRIRNRFYRVSVRCIRRHDRMHSVALQIESGASLTMDVLLKLCSPRCPWKERRPQTDTGCGPDTHGLRVASTVAAGDLEILPARFLHEEGRVVRDATTRLTVHGEDLHPH